MSTHAGTKSTLRVFCALELPEDVRVAAARHIEQLREAFPRLRVGWERAEKLHLTLKFLGEIEAGCVQDLARAVGVAAGGVPRFDLSVEGTGHFPPRGQPRVLWLGVRDESGGLSLLQKRLEEECAVENFPREARAFNPHLTVARLRTPEGARPLASLHHASEFACEPFAVREVVVMRSELGPVGSRYTPLSRHALTEP